MEERKKIMEIRRLLDFLKTAEQLKCNTRHSYTSSGRLESVAEHSWRLALMAMLVGDEFPEMDMDKVIKMAFGFNGKPITSKRLQEKKEIVKKYGL